MQSARLPPATLHPPSAPLPEIATQHLTSDISRKGVLALNSGGLHYFAETSPIEKLQILLLNSSVSSIGRDEDVKAFFKSYGYSEGCAMCLTISIHDGCSDTLGRKAIQAAMSHANRPLLVRSLQSTDAGVGGSATIQTFLPSNKVAGFEGYTFTPSSLHDSLIKLASRLLRPIWCKPAVVVTEGRTIPPKRKGGRPKHVPAKVEPLLDDATLEEVRRPLAALQNLMREVFEPAVKNIPGALIGDTEMKELNNSVGDDLISQAVQYQTQTRHQRNSRDQQPSDKDLNTAACLNEERNIHSIFRLVSRTVQLLSFSESYIVSNPDKVIIASNCSRDIFFSLSVSQVNCRPSLNRNIVS